MAKKISRNTFTTENSPSIMSFASIVGEKEGQGPLGSCFDRIGALFARLWTGNVGESRKRAAKADCRACNEKGKS